MRKVTVISEHDHWADYAEYIAPQHPQPDFTPKRKMLQALIFDGFLILCSIVALYLVYRIEV